MGNRSVFLRITKISRAQLSSLPIWGADAVRHRLDFPHQRGWGCGTEHRGSAEFGVQGTSEAEDSNMQIQPRANPMPALDSRYELKNMNNFCEIEACGHLSGFGPSQTGLADVRNHCCRLVTCRGKKD